ncbi:MAG TPA: cation-translocating P-type ATPase [Steroidobacteraceae bacterium]|nr:cation-translocating P-type ATPase [Steroidobacteraceae bacterium]
MNEANHSNALLGITNAEAERRLQQDGPNELPGNGPRSFGLIIREVLTEPMFILLLSAAAIYVVLGDIREALILSASVIIIIAIAVLQERRTENALARLRDLSSPRALVIRDGAEQRIPGRDVVAQDVVVLREGDRVPADAELIEATQLAIDESLLTGESLPVDKKPGPDPEFAHVFSGTLIATGFGKARVFATGPRTRIGAIGRALEEITRETTGLTLQMRRAVRWIAIGAIALCVLVAVLYWVNRGNWLAGILAGITLAMGVLPEEFPVVLTIFMAMGAWRISKHGVLTRRMPAVEILGTTTVLAVDKTGTLTENKMRVAVLDDLHRVADFRAGAGDLNADLENILLVAFAASEREPFDAMEKAIHEQARRLLPDRATACSSRALVKEYDITPDLLAVTHVWQEPTRSFEVAVKGAPETVMDLCRVDAETRSVVHAKVKEYGQQGLRVLAVATGRQDGAHMPDTPHGFDLRLLGLLCLADPLRADVPAALRECAQAGIRVIMITGDHPGTALAIAQQAGFDVSAGALTGAQLNSLDDSELAQRVRTVNVYARMTPEHKLRLVQALKTDGEVVAMTGDGVNDAPALKAAHVGVAMGARGTDVAREAASLVLLNDDFGSMVAAVRLGRRIYENLKHAVAFLVSVHIPIAGLGLVPVMLGWPLMFFPVHVLFLEFVIDPACSFVFEADDARDDVMTRPPRAPRSRLFSIDLIWRSVLNGALALAFCLVVYYFALDSMSEGQARALTFIGLVCMNLQLIVVSRAADESLRRSLSERNAVMWWIVIATLLATALAVFVPVIADVFHFEKPPAASMGVTFVASVVLMAALKFVLRKAQRQERPSHVPA